MVLYNNWLLNLLIWDEMIRLVDRGVLALMALEIDDRRVVPFAREFAWFAFSVRRYSHWDAFLLACRLPGNNFLPVPICSDGLPYGIIWNMEYMELHGLTLELQWILHGSLDVALQRSKSCQTFQARQAKCSSANTPAFADGILHAVATGSGFWSWLFLWQITM